MPSVDEKGSGLVETLIALAIVATALTVFIAGVSAASLSVGTVDEQVDIESLARSQLEYTKGQDYITAPSSYETITPPSPDYSISAEAVPLPGADSNIQIVTVTIYRDGQALLSIEDFKVNR